MNGFHDETNSSGILRQTKRIVKEGKKYRHFIFTHNRFKRMYFNHNETLNRLPMLFPYYYNNSLSLRRKGHHSNQYTFSRNTETYNEDQEEIKDSYEHPISIERNTITNNTISNPHLYNHKKFFLITETNISSPMNSIINNSYYNNSFRSYSNHYSFRTISSFKQHNTNSSFRRFHHDLFQNPRYDTLEYDESVIYGNKEQIYSYIDTKIHELAENTNHNNIEYLDKELIANENKFHIKLNSLNISFYDSKTNELCNEYVLPLALLPIFYYKDIEYFKMLLTKIVIFDTSYSSFTIEENILFKYLRNICKLPVILSPIKNSVEIESNHTSSNKTSPNKIAIKKMNTAHISKHPFSPFFQKKISIKTGKNKINHTDTSNSHFKQIDVELEIPEYNSKTINIYESNNSYHNKDTFNEKQNIFEFIWITPLKNYKVIIQTPTITLREKKTNLCIHSYINFEFLFYLHKLNFDEWDFYCLNYLFSYKQCRQIMNKLLSKLSYADSLPPVTPNTILYLNKKQNLLLNTQNCSELKFIASEKGTNRLIVIKPPSFKITLLKYSDNSLTDYQNDYIINFNISQAIKLIKSLDIVNSYKLKDLLEKFITVKHNNNNNLAPIVEFNYNAFNSINEEDWLELLKGIDKFSNKGEVTDEHLIDLNYNQMEEVNKKATEFVNPCLIKKVFNESGKEVIEQSEFILPLFKKLIKKDINCWPELCSTVLNAKKKENSDLVKINGLVRRKTFHFKSPAISPKINKKKTGTKG